MNPERNFNLENKRSKEEFNQLTQSLEYLDEQRELLKNELSELQEPVSILIRKQSQVKNSKEYEKIEKEIADYYTKNDGEILKKEESLKNRLNQCNRERMLYHRRDLVNTYLVINSSLSDAYDVLFSLDEKSEKIKEVEKLIADLEEGLSKIKNDLYSEGVGEEEALNYNKKYE